MMKCMNCGHYVTEEEHHCRECGAAHHLAEAHSTSETLNTTVENYRIAIGEKSAKYYLARFEKFDSGASKLSWNWPAFFFTFYWLLYRKLWGYSAAYFLLLMLGGLLAPLYLIVGYVLFPIFANYIYYKQIKNKIHNFRSSERDASRLSFLIEKSCGTSNLALVIAVFLSIFQVGILAAIALPAYQDYTVRARISEPLAVLAEQKTLSAQHRLEFGRWPIELDHTARENVASSNMISSLELDADGTVRAILTSPPQLEGKSLSIVPTMSDDGSVLWTCTSDDIESKYLPSSCRG